MSDMLPKVVLNLRKIWAQKKEELEINQTQAAEKLGWTQGAFSQYLNNITELNHEAVTKFANFLDVAPEEIDPDYSKESANFTAIPISMYWSKPTKRPHRTIRLQKLCSRSNWTFIELDTDIPGIGEIGDVLACFPYKDRHSIKRIGDSKPLIVWQSKSEDVLHYDLGLDKMPPANQCAKRLVVRCSYYW